MKPIHSPILAVNLVSIPLRGSHEALACWAERLDPPEKARAVRFVFEDARTRFVAARGQLRELLGGLLGTAPAAVRIALGTGGKPWLPDAPDLLFNLSHSGDQGLIGWRWRDSDGERVGVDVEAATPVRNFAGLAKHSFSLREQAVILGLTGTDQRRAFYEIWSKKEAVIKALGDGVAYGLRRFSAPFGDELLHFDDPAEDAARWRVEAIDLGPEFAAAIAWREGGPFS